MTKLLAALGSLALLAGLAVAVVPAGANVAQGLGGDTPWPTLRVTKTYPAGQSAPAGAVFSITVNCERLHMSLEVDGQSFDETVLTFTADGTTNPAAPTDATPADGWVKDGAYWTFTSKWIQHKDCTAEETAVSSPGGPVQNRCDFTSTLVGPALTSEDAEAAGVSSGSPGCVNPANGETAAGPTPPGEVHFTSPWDLDWSAEPKTCDAGPPDLEDTSALGGSHQKCHQVGTLTVINSFPVITATTVGTNTVVVTGSGFPASTLVTVDIQSTPLVLGTVTADANGSFTKSFTVPCEVGAGSHTVTATAATGQHASTGITLVACAPVPLSAAPSFAG